MDSEHWISRLAAAKRYYAAQLGRVDDVPGMGTEEVEMEVEDDGDMEMELEMALELGDATWPEVACPYCYEDHDVASLCIHLEEDHPYEPHAAPCPICSQRITRDMLNHITMQHGYLFKNGHRSRRFIVPESHAISLLSRDLRGTHLQALLGGGHGHRSNNAVTTNISSDPLLSSFGLSFSASDAPEPSKSASSIPDGTAIRKETPVQPWESSIDSSLTSEEREQKRKQATGRATFVQGLVMSTLFGD
ncbi:Protein DEHYDRATION-INDUCED 19 3 [Zea mays]|uniref:Drought-induced 19 n=3 Tax=Zea mays TaxID=4577 RepID=B4FDK3_MAIZE|nr:fiber protein Fb2 [Zea mays]ACF80196.1 unknown [Zea mays]ACG33233.1 fiber protein Fb2 [Zea mays]ACG34501.1 fiber protein Fb2 [Zea mays]ONM39440.1 drought-induced 19 [Zea mays]PWZ34073.1 Protein DEHYDRATION-INDUCED 19 3 [Zea mays]|eukprot:NP_001131679.1 fiber protein Fb2 [Zea mays]